MYWDERAHYLFSSREVDESEAATNELQRLCLEAGQHIIDRKRYLEFGIPIEAVAAIEWAWNAEPPAIYGRFDLAYDGISPPKLLEYNADTPTALLEASVVQWYWLQDLHPKDDQFNSIHEKLVAKWTELKNYCSSPLFFAAAEDVQAEDLMTVTYLRDTAAEAGHQTLSLLLKDIGWDEEAKKFVDLDGRAIKSIFKLYPWEWVVHEAFGPKVLERPAALRQEAENGARGSQHHYVGDTTIETGGDYGEEGFVYQALAPVPVFEGNYAVLGSWVVDGAACGMGVRESAGPITGNMSRFVPHLFR